MASVPEGVTQTSMAKSATELSMFRPGTSGLFICRCSANMHLMCWMSARIAFTLPEKSLPGTWASAGLASVCTEAYGLGSLTDVTSPAKVSILPR